MLKNYIRVALRNLNRNRTFSFINIFGLALSMSVCMGIIMLVSDQLTYDRHNTKHDRIFRIVTRLIHPDGSPSGNDCATTPLPLAETLTKEYTGVEKAVRIKRGFGNGWLELEPGYDVNIPLSGFFADPEFLNLFECTLEYGDASTALADPYSVVLTKKAARKLFRQENPVGETIKVGDLGEYTVTGVISESKNKSHIVYEALASYSTVNSLTEKGTLSAYDSGWGNFTSGWVYLLLEEAAKKSEIERHLTEIAKKNPQEKIVYGFYLQNLIKITPGPFINNAIGPFMPMIFVYFFAGLALITTLTSCFNYTNLSVARSLTRAREIGVRKVNGAHRFQIFFQFVAESIVMALFALGVAWVLLLLVKPFMLHLKFAQTLKWDLEGNIYVYGVFLVFSIFIGFLAGFFPAVILSKFQPVNVLKNLPNIKLISKIALRKILLVTQFTFSLIFIISALLLNNQLNLFTESDHGFTMNNKITVRLSSTSHETLKTALDQHSSVENVSAVSHIPATGITYGHTFKRQISDVEGILLEHFFVDEDYLENMDIPLIAGRFFDERDNSRKNLLVINEQAVKAFRFSNPQETLGELVYDENDSAEFKIIGVVKDYNHQMLVSKIAPMALRWDEEQFGILQVKFNGNRDHAIRAIEASWSSVNPSLTPVIKDFEEEIHSFYNTVFSDLVNIVAMITAMAVFISSLGLLGIATYTIEIRMKEISIRKVLGSTAEALVLLLSKGFLILIMISISLAVPLAWFINNQWLEHIAYRTPLNFTVILAGVTILIIIAMITIGSQALRAAYTNPADVLKNE